MSEDHNDPKRLPASPLDPPEAGPENSTERNDGYSVGYGRPPKAFQFQPHQSGNLRGRPKGARSLGAILNGVLARKATLTENGKTWRVSGLEAAVHRVRNDALRGDLGAMRLLLSMVERYAEPEGAAKLEDLLQEDLEVLARYANPDASPSRGGAKSKAAQTLHNAPDEKDDEESSGSKEADDGGADVPESEKP